jgi:hypothetical protein
VIPRLTDPGYICGFRCSGIGSLTTSHQAGRRDANHRSRAALLGKPLYSDTVVDLPEAEQVVAVHFVDDLA